MRTALCIVLLLAGTLSAQDKKDETSFRLYQVAGRTWTIKQIPGAGGDGNLEINYMHHEVLAVYPDYALCASIRFDKFKKIPKGVEPSEYRVYFKADLPPFKQPEGSKSLGVSTVKAAGQSFECEGWQSGTPPSNTYVSKRYPGLVVRVEASFGNDELSEFDAYAEDDPPPAKKPKKGEKEPAKPEPDAPAEGPNFALFKAKHSWLLSERIGSVEGFKRFEVVKFDADGADLKQTELDANRKPLKGAKSEISRIDFKDPAAPAVAAPLGARTTRVEKRKVAAGIFECTVYELKIDGKEVQLWISVKYPGLVVRKLVGTRGKDGISELIEFKD